MELPSYDTYEPPQEPAWPNNLMGARVSYMLSSNQQLTNWTQDRKHSWWKSSQLLSASEVMSPREDPPASSLLN